MMTCWYYCQNMEHCTQIKTLMIGILFIFNFIRFKKKWGLLVSFTLNAKTWKLKYVNIFNYFFKRVYHLQDITL